MNKNNERAEYTTVSLPKKLMKNIENFIQSNPSYRSQAEFVRDAIREKLSMEKSENNSNIRYEQNQRKIQPMQNSYKNLKRDDEEVRDNYELESLIMRYKMETDRKFEKLWEKINSLNNDKRENRRNSSDRIVKRKLNPFEQY